MQNGTGIKGPARLISYLTPVSAYRVVETDDAAMTPTAPPDVPVIPLNTSPTSLNTIALYVSPAAGDTTVLELWVGVEANNWFKIGSKTLAAAGIPEVILFKDVPALPAMVLVTGISAGPAVILEAHSN